MANPPSNGAALSNGQCHKILFIVGRLVSTPGALKAVLLAGEDVGEFLQRHRSGDWGTVDAEDRAANDRAVKFGERILSAYVLRSRVELWIITEADRSITTILLPDEY